MSKPSSESDEAGPSSPKKTKKRQYKQKFRNEWLEDNEFKKWLKCDPKNEYRAMCVFCNATMLADKGAIKRHGEGSKHISRTKATSQRSVATIFQTKSAKTLEENTKAAEIKLAAFIAEHKISHKTMDHLVELLPNIFTDSEIANNLKMKHTKLQAVVNNVLGVAEKQDLGIDLKNEKFSVMVDESTDIGTVKTMCVVVRYYCKQQGRIVSKFWDLIQIFGDEKAEHRSTAEHLYNAILKSFRDHSIPIENIIGFGSDGCNTMMGCHNSVSSRFRVECPGIIIIKCICHSLHLCASDACKQLPPQCEKLVRDIYNYFGSSSKRQSDLREFQSFANVEIHKILRPSQTRWLSLLAVVDRIIEQWSVLTLYFNAKWLEDNTCQEIHHHLNDPIMKAYFYFLNWMLPKFTKVNTFFQSENPVVTLVHGKMNELYSELLTTYMTPTYIKTTDLDKINPTDENNFKSLDEIYLGLGVSKQLSSYDIDHRLKLELKERCRKFIIQACVGIRKRYSLNDPVMSAISKLDPENCLGDQRDDSLHPLFTLLPRLTPESLTEQQELDDQWRKLPSLKNTINFNQAPDTFWHQVRKYFLFFKT